MNEFEGALSIILPLFAAFWMSPKALSWVAAKILARRDALRTQKMAMRWHLARLDAE